MTVTLAATPAQAASSVRYVALGDSYASGVGAGSESGTCQRSPNAYPALWAAANAPASYVSVACSGATTTTVINSQLSALSSTTTLVSISVGGNDMGFSNIMSTCALKGTTECVAAVQAAEDKARSSLTGLLNNVYNGIRSKAPNARVVVLDYPVFYQLGTTCVGLSATSRTKINEGINVIDDIIRSAAQAHGFVFADVRSIFVGHQLCSGDKWLHALNFASLSISYHPNSSGHAKGYLPVFRTAAG
ncbi:SGNH/GDSL hydrolase family protein [Catellatospora sp. KI3]|uniref:SGNH/GDSL hydrolase family protein n=1 Tax=Catellatospora sp. KI3 TaxID=3041620 RepID=UPI002482E6D6|nr:SGNH/GDSL hydrolase family protein [Catellatospora sp. KI3]MDI1463011.1 SGNH/GDSL hydrolase family protein [Catellatospora sp. KI3]